MIYHDNQPPYPGSAEPETGGRRERVDLTSSITDTPPVDPFADTNSLGLRKFNIGTVPASVTPPTTWRRAAWFSVLASAGALAGLISLSIALAGPPKSTEQIGLPGIPGNAPQFPFDKQDNPPGGPTSSPFFTDRPSGSMDRRDRGRGELPNTARQPSLGNRTGTRPGGDGGAGRGSDVPAPPGSSSVPGPTRAAPPPEIIIVPVEPRRGFLDPRTTDGQRMAERTVRYFDLVTNDPAAAYQLTDGSQSVEELRQRYDGVSSIEVKSVRSDPNSATTATELTVTKSDGSMTTQQRTLTFTPTEDPKIHADS